MMAAILNSTILDSAILVFLSNSLTLAKIGSHHLHKKPSLIHSDSTWWWQPSQILAMLDSDTFLSSLGFTQKQSPSTLTIDSN